jgi:hypothetical protein
VDNANNGLHAIENRSLGIDKLFTLSYGSQLWLRCCTIAITIIIRWPGCRRSFKPNKPSNNEVEPADALHASGLFTFAAKENPHDQT